MTETEEQDGLDRELSKLTFHLLSIGIDDYMHHPNLYSAEASARAFWNVMHKKYGFNDYNNYCWEFSFLKNSEATCEAIHQELRRYSLLLDKNDCLVIFFAGHGFFDEEFTEKSYLVPHDATDSPAKMISYDEIKVYFEKMSARKILLISDACFSGGVFRWVAEDRISSDDTYFHNALCGRSVEAVSSGGMQLVYDRGFNGFSAFFFHFQNALIENSQKYVDIKELVNSIYRNVEVDAGQAVTHQELFDAGHQSGSFVFAQKSHENGETPREATEDEHLGATPKFGSKDDQFSMFDYPRASRKGFFDRMSDQLEKQQKELYMAIRAEPSTLLERVTKVAGWIFFASLISLFASIIFYIFQSEFNWMVLLSFLFVTFVSFFIERYALRQEKRRVFLRVVGGMPMLSRYDLIGGQINALIESMSQIIGGHSVQALAPHVYAACNMLIFLGGNFSSAHYVQALEQLENSDSSMMKSPFGKAYTSKEFLSIGTLSALNYRKKKILEVLSFFNIEINLLGVKDPLKLVIKIASSSDEHFPDELIRRMKSGLETYYLMNGNAQASKFAKKYESLHNRNPWALVDVDKLRRIPILDG